jgi:hypothetical protein
MEFDTTTAPTVGETGVTIWQGGQGTTEQGQGTGTRGGVEAKPSAFSSHTHQLGDGTHA